MIMMTLTGTEHSLIKLVPKVITKVIINEKWLLLETNYLMRLRNEDYPNTDS